MKRFYILIFAIFMSVGAMAQLEVKPNSFKEVTGFINLNTDIYSDDNNVLYAVVKVKTENINDKQRRELLFEGDAQTFIECEYKVGEVWVYITYKASYLKISHPDLSSTEFWFPFDMEPKKGYELTLVNNAKVTSDEILERINELQKQIQNQQEQQIIYVEKPKEPATPPKPKKHWNSFILANGSINTYGKPAFGVTFGTMRKVGFFFSYMSNFNFTSLGEEELRDHHKFEYIQTLIDNNPGYTVSQSYVSMSVLFGLIFKVYGPVNLKIGAGYSNNSLWAKVYDLNNKRTDYWVSDYSAYGFGGLAGVQAHFGKFAVSLEGATTNFKIYEARIGIGYCIGEKKQ